MGTRFGRMLAAAFKAPPERKSDPFRQSRERAKVLAALHGIELEKAKGGGGMNVWPPKTLADENDPFDADHYAEDWDDALDRVQRYASIQIDSASASR